MYIVYTDFVIKNKIIIKKLGLTFRTLSKKEKEFLQKQIELILNYKKDINSLFKKYYQHNKNNEILLDIIKFNPTKREILMAGYTLLESGFKFNSNGKINYIIDHLLIIEFNENELGKYVNKQSTKKFVSNFLSLYNLHTSTIEPYKMKIKSDYSFILNDDILFNTSNIIYHDILINILMSYSDKDKKIKNHVLKYIELSEDYLKTMMNFIDSLSQENIFKFVEVIDLLYSDSYTIQTKILNYVTIAESLIINENDNIEKSYILKGGMILKNYLGKESKSSNEAVKLLLGFVYNIRSDIIHGNIKKIENDLNKINQKNVKIKEMVGETPEFLSKRERAFQISYTISLFLARCTIKYWIDNPYKIDYLKNN